MSLFLRVDDFPGTKPEEFHAHNLENFKWFDFYMKKRGIRYVLGVIPGYAKPGDLRWIAEQDNITVAMHGVVHSECSLDEFGGMQYRDIENALCVAKDRLEVWTGARVVDYVPPHNTINADTVLALSRLGFSYVYGGPETETDMRQLVGLMKMEYRHSQSPLEYGRSDELMERGSVEHLIKRVRCGDEVWLGLHWTWEVNIGLRHLDEYLSQIEDLF